MEYQREILTTVANLASGTAEAAVGHIPTFEANGALVFSSTMS